jgi:hypothetical protein
MRGTVSRHEEEPVTYVTALPCVASKDRATTAGVGDA